VNYPVGDFPDDPEPSVDPVLPNTGSPQKADSDAIRSGDPVDSGKVDHEMKAKSVTLDAEVKGFRRNPRISAARNGSESW